MVPQKLEIIRSLECREGQREVMASYCIGSWNIYEIKRGKDELQPDMAASENEKDLFRQQTKESKLKQLDKLLCG